MLGACSTLHAAAEIGLFFELPCSDTVKVEAPEELSNTEGQDRHFAVMVSYMSCCQDPDFFGRFYTRLVKSDPRMAAMFARTDMQQQYRLLQQAIGALIQYAKNSSYGREMIERLARSHARSGHNASPDLYPLWVNALVTTIAETDDNFSLELEERWRAVLAYGTSMMVAGYQH